MNFELLFVQFSLTILGSGAAIPLADRNPTAQILQLDNRKFLLDCGEGTQMQIRRFSSKPQQISNIFISHLHGDHFYGLIGLINTFHLLNRKSELNLYGNPALKEIIDLQMEHSHTTLNYPLIFHPVDPEKSQVIFEDDQVSVRTIPLVHRIPTCGFLIREKTGKQRSYAYCTDTAYSEKIIPLIRNCDLLYHEATFTHDRQSDAHAKYHSTAKEAATIALKAGVKKLVIGHFSARYENAEVLLGEARAVFPETYLAADGLKFQI